MGTNTATTAADDNAIMKYGMATSTPNPLMTTMTKGSLEEFAAHMLLPSATKPV